MSTFWTITLVHTVITRVQICTHTHMLVYPPSHNRHMHMHACTHLQCQTQSHFTHGHTISKTRKSGLGLGGRGSELLQGREMFGGATRAWERCRMDSEMFDRDGISSMGLELRKTDLEMRDYRLQAIIRSW